MRTCPKCGNRYPQLFAACPVDGAALGSRAPSVSRIEAADPNIGRVLSGYTILDLVGRGGMGAVYRGRNTDTGQAVAIKMLHPSASPSAVARFEREARAMLGLSHPSIVEVFDFGQAPDGSLYMVMELLEGEDLQKRLARGPLPTDLALDVALQLARALSVAHARGAVHRDLKPGNVFLVPAEPSPIAKILDFGVAKLHGESLAITLDRGIIGTPFYMAPEQARGEPDVDARADLYALGAILYEMLTGRVPLSADSQLTVLVRILTEMPSPPSRLRPSLGAGIDALVLRALGKTREERWPTAAAFADELAAALEEQQGLSSVERWSVPPPALPAEEVRLMTVVLAESDEPELALHEPFFAAARSHGGAPDRLLGGRCIAVFGSEVSFGDEAVRALRFALSVRRPGVRIGVGTGRVHAGAKTTFSGEPVGGAGTLARASAPASVTIDAATHQRTRGLFDVRPGDVGAFEVLGERSRGLLIRTRDVMGVETPTVGRDAELAQIRALFHRAVRDRAPQVVSVVGPAGVGKTRVKHELRLFVEGLGGEVVAVEGHGEPMSVRSPYSVYSLALRRLAKIAVGEPEERSREKLEVLVAEVIDAERAGEVAAGIGSLIGVPFPQAASDPALREPRRARERAQESMLAYFHALAAARTVMLVLEDAHWADPFSLEITERLVAQGDGRSIFVLALGRPELFEGRPELWSGCDHQRVDLRPLTRRASHELVRALLGGDPPAGLEEAITERAAGNPYFIEESLASLRDRGVLQRDRSGRWLLVEDPSHAPVPESVEAVLQSRLDALPQEEKELLKRAAVFGRAFWDDALAALGVDDLARLLGNLRSRDILATRSPSRFAGTREFNFRHALMCDAAYALLPEAQRRVLHRAAAQFFIERAEDDAATIARHLDLSGDAELAARYHLNAARHDAREDASEVALEHVDRALCLTSQPTVRFDLLVLQVEVLARLGRRREQRSALDKLPDLARVIGDPWREAIWRMRLGQLQRMTAEYAAAAGNLATALGYFQQLARDEDAIEALTELGAIAQSVGDYRQALDHVDDALELCENLKRPDLEAGAQMVAANALLGLGDLDSARQRCAASAECFARLGDGFRQTLALVNLGNLHNALGRAAQAAETLEVALALASRLGAVSLEGYIHANRGVAQARLGQLDAAVESEQLAFRIASESDDARLLSACGTYLALICLDRRAERDVPRAQSAAVAALAAARDASLEEFQALAHMALARVYLACGEKSDALREARDAVRRRERLRGVQEREEEIYWTLVQALVASGHTAEAREVLARARLLVEERAARLPDEELRRSFLEGVPANRAILEAAAREQRA